MREGGEHSPAPDDERHAQARPGASCSASAMQAFATTVFDLANGGRRTGRSHRRRSREARQSAGGDCGVIPLRPMVIVITKPEYRTIREALRRLRYRDIGHAGLILGNLFVGWLMGLGLLVGLPVAGVYLTISGGLVRILTGVVITLAGPVMAKRFKSFLEPRLLMVAWLLVDSAVPGDATNVAPLTRYERSAVEALKELVGRVIAPALLTAEDRDWDRLLPLKAEWLDAAPRYVHILSRGSSVTERFEMIGKLLIDGSQRPTSAHTFARMIVVIGREADRALENLLAGKPVEMGGTTWPCYYDQDRLHDLAHHGGEPVSQQKHLDGYERRPQN